MWLGIIVYISLDVTAYYFLETFALTMSSLEQGPCFGNVRVPPGGSAQGRQHYRYKGDVIETTTNKQPHSFGSKSPLAEKS